MEPWEGEGGRYFGASMAAIGVGTAGERLCDGRRGRSRGLSSLRKYLIKNYGTQNLHNRVWMLWASAKMDGLLTRPQTDESKHRSLRSSSRMAGSAWAHWVSFHAKA